MNHSIVSKGRLRKMVSNKVITEIATELRNRMNGRGWITLDRHAVTGLLRRFSGKPTARIGSQVAQDLERALATQGIKVIPGLGGKRQYVRLVWADKLVAQWWEQLSNPEPEGDVWLAHMVTKIKGRWDDTRGDINGTAAT